MYIIGSAIVLAFIVWQVLAAIKGSKKAEQEAIADNDYKLRMQKLEEQLLIEKILTQEHYAQLDEQEKARIQVDWDKVWPSIEQKLLKISDPNIRESLAQGLSTVGTFEATMNTLNWNYLLEGAIPQIPPSGREQINQTIQKRIDQIRDELKK